MLLTFLSNIPFDQFKTTGPITTDALINVIGVMLTIFATYWLSTRQFKKQIKETTSTAINDERPYFNIDSFGNTIIFSFYNKSNSIVNFLDIYVEQTPNYGDLSDLSSSCVPIYKKYSIGHSPFNTPIVQQVTGDPISCIIECTTLSNEKIIFFYLHGKTSSIHRISETVRFSSESATHKFLKNDPQAQKDYVEFKSKFN